MEDIFFRRIDIVLFDLGGVLVEFSGIPTMLEWTGNKYDENRLWEIWLNSQAVRSFETGRSTTDQFAERIIKEMDLPLGQAEFINSFSQWPKCLFPGVAALLSEFKKHYTLACFSNSNEIHWPILMKKMGLDDMFDFHFASHIMGKLKPDQESFEYVLQSLGCKASSVLFLDDNEINIKSARKVGIEAHRITGPDEIMRIFKEANIFNSSDIKN
jgi:HAD superfamily hydrolase (TIGR01509 family)